MRILRRPLAEMLDGGDRRSIGNSNKVVKLVLSQPRRFAELFGLLWHEDAIVRLRAADAVEKITLAQPKLLNPHKKELLGLLAETEQIELRWHLALMIPRVQLNAPERQSVVGILEKYLGDRSSIVKTCALQALSDLSVNDPELRNSVQEILEISLRTGTPAMKARARKLKELNS